MGDQGFYDGTFTYNREQRVTTYTDSLGSTSDSTSTRRTRSSGGRPARQRHRVHWDRYDRLLSRTDPLGRTTSYEYTVDGELAAVVRPDGSRVRVDRHDDGELSIAVAGGERNWQRVYPASSAPDVLAAQVGVATAFHPDRQWGTGASPDAPGTPVERDLFGRPRVVTDAAGGRTHLGWTVEGRRASRVGPLGRREEWRYDGEGNTVEHASAPGRRARSSTALRPAGGEHRPRRRQDDLEYDTELRLTRITNPAGLTWRYSYDPAGRLVEETDFDGRMCGSATTPPASSCARSTAWVRSPPTPTTNWAT